MKKITEESTKYICDVCTCFYESEREAAHCEALGEPSEEPLKVGEKLRYQEENQMMTRWSYSSAENLIVEVKAHPTNGNTKHCWIYKVKPEFGRMRWVVPLADSAGYSSPVEFICYE